MWKTLLARNHLLLSGRRVRPRQRRKVEAQYPQIDPAAARIRHLRRCWAYLRNKMSSAHPSIRKLIYRYSGTTASVSGSTVITISGVPQKGHIAQFHVVNDTDNVVIIPVISSEATCTSTHIDKILESSSSHTEPEIPTQPIYYEAHDDSGTMKIYLKPTPASGTKTISYRIDIWAAA